LQTPETIVAGSRSLGAPNGFASARINDDYSPVVDQTEFLGIKKRRPKLILPGMNWRCCALEADQRRSTVGREHLRLLLGEFPNLRAAQLSLLIR